MTTTVELANTVPSSPEDRKKLKNMIVEMTNSMSRIDAEREHKKEIATDIKQTFGLQTKMINKLATTMYKRNYANLQSENEDFEMLYETLVEGKSSS